MHELSTLRRLSTAEGEILRMLWEGLTVNEMAGRRTVSPRTIGNQLNGLYKRLNVNNRMEAVRRGLELGLLDAPEARPHVHTPVCADCGQGLGAA